jgi:Protein kinase domain
MTGTTIGKYRILGRLGTGGMGTVYKALDETLEREVAIKVLNRGLTDPAIIKRFRAEATTLAKLNHPAIATIYELFQCGDELLIVMEFVRGETVETLLARMGVLTLEQAVFVVDRVLSALAHTHRAGIVHCDIKPSNIMVGVQGGVTIMDFGTARAWDTERAAAHAYMIGTPAYMAPEQVLGHELDGRTDVYAVGVLLYRLVTGALPFTGETAIEAMRKQIADAPTPAAMHRPDLPAWCDRIVERALAKLPTDRFQTAEEFRDALHEASGIVTTELAKAFVAPMADIAAVSGAPTIIEALGAVVQVAPTVHRPPSTSPAPALALRLGPRRLTFRTPRPLIGAVAFAIPLLAVATLRALSSAVAGPSTSPPISAPAPMAALPVPAAPLPPPPTPEGEPDKPRVSVPGAFVFEARVMAGRGKSLQECKCSVLLANGGIIWRTADKRHPINAVKYVQVAAMAYSHGRDPLWNGPGGPTPVVRAGSGPFSAFGIFTQRDWLSLRVTDPRLRFVVLRFDDVKQASSAISALEERTGRRIERLPKRRL